MAQEKGWEGINSALPMGDTLEKESDIAIRIKKTFRVWERMINSIVDGHSRAALVSGATGCGKSYPVERILNEAVGTSRERKFKIIAGSMSPVDLYKRLYDNRNEGDVLVVDDCDNVYFNIDSLNLLKAALDTRKTRIISWNKESWALNTPTEDGEGSYPKELQYQGSAIFCTNIDLAGESSKNRKVSRHQAALLDRGTYLDLRIHTKREILVRMWQVMQTTTFLADNEIPLGNAKMILQWTRANLDKIRAPSLRMAIKLNQQISSDPEEWEETAEATLFGR